MDHSVLKAYDDKKKAILPTNFLIQLAQPLLDVALCQSKLRLMDNFWSAYQRIIVLTQPLYHKQDVTQSLFLSVVQVRIQSFPSFKLVVLPKLKNPLCPIIYLSMADRKEMRWIQVFPKGIKMKWNTIRFIQDLNSDRRLHFLW